MGRITAKRPVGGAEGEKKIMKITLRKNSACRRVTKETISKIPLKEQLPTKPTHVPRPSRKGIPPRYSERKDATDEKEQK